MPKRKYTRRPRKRTFKKRRRRRRAVPTAFPDTHVVRLKYTDFISIDLAQLENGLIKNHFFRANSIYDPDLTGTGHQPSGRDQFAAIYDHYTVIGSKIKCTFLPYGDNPVNIDQYCMLAIQDTTDNNGTIIDACEQAKASCKVMPFGINNKVTLTQTYSPRRFFGIPKKDAIRTKSGLEASAGANPAEDAIFAVSVGTPLASSINPSPIRVKVDLEYLVKWSERRPLSRS